MAMAMAVAIDGQAVNPTFPEDESFHHASIMSDE